MILSDGDIKKALDTGVIGIIPKPDYAVQLGSCSIDLRLGSQFRVFNHSKLPFIDTNMPIDSEKLMNEISVADKEPFILQPGDFVLATTLEHLKMPDFLLGRLEGRSSLGRLGIVVHSTASVFDPGFEGKIVMELGNLGRMPVALYPGMRICALTFEELSHPALTPYNKKTSAKYIHQDSPLTSKIGEDSKRAE